MQVGIYMLLESYVPNRVRQIEEVSNEDIFYFRKNRKLDSSDGDGQVSVLLVFVPLQQ